MVLTASFAEHSSHTSLFVYPQHHPALSNYPTMARTRSSSVLFALVCVVLVVCTRPVEGSFWSWDAFRSKHTAAKSTTTSTSNGVALGGACNSWTLRCADGLKCVYTGFTQKCVHERVPPSSCSSMSPCPHPFSCVHGTCVGASLYALCGSV